MGKFKWGKSSSRRINTVHEALQYVAREVIKRSEIDICVPWMGGRRSSKDQHEIYLAGNSKLDGFKKRSYHQTGLALDVVPYNQGPDYKDTWGFKYLNILIKDIWDSSKYKEDYILENGWDLWSWDEAHWQIRAIRK